MAFDVKKIPHIVDQIRSHKRKQSYSDAQLVADLNSFAHRGWGESYITRLLAGTLQPGADTIDVFEKYLLVKFYHYNYS